jgi:DnaJ-domain-containing protein 1
MSSTPPNKRLLMGTAPSSRPPPSARETIDDDDDAPIEVGSIPPLPPDAPTYESLAPDELEPDADDIVLRWDATLDEADYFTLLRLDAQANEETTIRDAFHRFALAFHPDRYHGADDSVRDAANRVYCRGAEAYRVLLDPLLRRRYVRLLGDGTLRMSPEEIADSLKGDEGAQLADLVKSAAARPFAKRADELIAVGDMKQARLQLRLALTKEPHNPRLEERMRELEQRIAGKRA